MVSRVSSVILDAEVINDQGEANAVGAMEKKARYSGILDVVKRGEVLTKTVLGEFSGLRKSIHALRDAEEDVITIDVLR